MKRMMNEVTGNDDNALEPAPWQAKSLEPLRNKGRSKVLHPMVIQRARYLVWDPDKDPQPSEGLYYCARFPQGWYPLAYPFDDLGEVDHSVFWQKHAAPVLACLWAERTGIDADQLERELYTRQYAFPRGRVESTSRGVYRILYGEDLPASISNKMINRAFGLPDHTPWEKGQHETCLMADRDYARKRLDITETWPAVDQLYGYVKIRSPKPD